MKTKPSFISLLLLAAILTLVTNCKKDFSGAKEVIMHDNLFEPSTITILAGTTIFWINKESNRHTVSSDDKLFDSGEMRKGKSFSFTFVSTGTYSYHCKIYGGMKGTVVVR
jgi:plastocyanin